MEETVLLRQVTDKLLQKVNSVVELVEPESASSQTLRQIAATLKDIRDLQCAKNEEVQALTVVLEGQTELFSK